MTNELYALPFRALERDKGRGFGLEVHKGCSRGGALEVLGNLHRLSAVNSLILARF